MKRLLSRPLACTSLLVLAALCAAPAHATGKRTEPPAKKRTNAVKPAKAAHAADESGEYTDFTQWRAVNEFIDEMHAEHGFETDALRALFKRVQFREQVIKLIIPPPPGKAKNWTAYRDRFIEPRRIQAGVAFWNEHEQALARASAEFGVPADVIVGILGVETMYGQNTGKFSVLDALTTLAFAYPDTQNRDARMRYFRGELQQTLLYARENQIDPFALKGSFAGAIGWPQFMPGSIRRFAVDFDGDGRIDLRNSPVDAIGSIASFLAQHGWAADQPVVFPATVSADGSWSSLLGLGLKATVSHEQLLQSGVSLPEGVPASLSYGLVDLQDGERPTRYWAGTNNFFAITQYNRSYYYAMAVFELGQAIHRQRAR